VSDLNGEDEREGCTDLCALLVSMVIIPWWGWVNSISVGDGSNLIKPEFCMCDCGTCEEAANCETPRSRSSNQMEAKSSADNARESFSEE
jgi:hypothetical protein